MRVREQSLRCIAVTRNQRMKEAAAVNSALLLMLARKCEMIRTIDWIGKLNDWIGKRHRVLDNVHQ